MAPGGMDLSSAGVRGQLRLLMQGSFGVPLLLLTVLAMMTLPVPPVLLDVLFSFNIALSLVVLLVAVYAMRPLDFAVFPTILLITTLLRLALNVASTRVVLLEGHTGADAAGKVIESFGNVVIGGNYVVGMVVFLILIIINFVVVTKGAGRISEVSARFTLDAMPGKQMAIDEIRARRRGRGHADSRHQPDRWSGNRHDAARHGVRGGDAALLAVDYRRWPGRTNPFAVALDHGRNHGYPRKQRARHERSGARADVRVTAGGDRGGRCAADNGPGAGDAAPGIPGARRACRWLRLVYPQADRCRQEKT